MPKRTCETRQRGYHSKKYKGIVFFTIIAKYAIDWSRKAIVRPTKASKDHWKYKEPLEDQQRLLEEEEGYGMANKGHWKTNEPTAKPTKDIGISRDQQRLLESQRGHWMPQKATARLSKANGRSLEGQRRLYETLGIIGTA